MNLKNIKEIVNNNIISDDMKYHLIIEEIAKSEDVIPTVMLILNQERQQKQDLINELNVLLSKAHTGLEEPEFNKDGFMQKEITEFYKKGKIGHVFKDINK